MTSYLTDLASAFKRDLDRRVDSRRSQLVSPIVATEHIYECKAEQAKAWLAGTNKDDTSQLANVLARMQAAGQPGATMDDAARLVTSIAAQYESVLVATEGVRDRFSGASLAAMAAGDEAGLRGAFADALNALAGVR